MSNYTNKDLLFTGYSKKADGGDNPKYIGTIDRAKVDKTEEYEVIYFCNHFLEDYNVPKTIESFQNVERLLHNIKLKNVDSRAELVKWIAENWHTK